MHIDLSATKLRVSKAWKFLHDFNGKLLGAQAINSFIDFLFQIPWRIWKKLSGEVCSYQIKQKRRHFSYAEKERYIKWFNVFKTG